MTSEAYVWTWLPDATQPVVAGRLSETVEGLQFNYGQSYLSREDSVALYLPELPLKSGRLPLLNGLSMPGCIRDAAPDAWGRRVILHRRFGLSSVQMDSGDLNEITYLLESGSDRIGALDFQVSARDFVSRTAEEATLQELIESADRVEKGLPLSHALATAIQHGTEIGGARPKATLRDGETKWIAKFSSSTDILPMVQMEFIAMRLASLAGLSVANAKLVKAAGKDVLLVERFDRCYRGQNEWSRRSMVSALTMLELDENFARYASYQDLAEIIRHRFARPTAELRELFSRLTFNILCGNTDDHARNHAAFWDGSNLSLTPAYDICPQVRTGQEATQAMLILGENRFSQLKVCVDAAGHFQLNEDEARHIIDEQLAVISANWESVCDAAGISDAFRQVLWQNQFLNPFALQGYHDR